MNKPIAAQRFVLSLHLDKQVAIKLQNAHPFTCSVHFLTSVLVLI